MRYLPLTEADRSAMLDVIGAPSVDALFADVPAEHYLDRPIEGLPLQMRATASFGVAVGARTEPLAELFARADEALYRAKQGGRDSVCTASPRPPEAAAPAAPLPVRVRRMAVGE